MKIKVLSRSNHTADAHVGDILEVEPEPEIFAAIAAGIVGVVDYGEVPSGRGGSGAVHEEDSASLDEGQAGGPDKGRSKRTGG